MSASIPVPHFSMATDFGAIRIQQALVLSIGTIINPLPQPVAMQTSKTRAACCRIWARSPPSPWPRTYAQSALPALLGQCGQALTVDINNPPQITQAVGTRFAQGFWYVAFVNLGITYQGVRQRPGVL